MTGRLSDASMTRALARHSVATTAAAPGLRFVATAIPVRRSGVTTALIHLDQQAKVKASARMVRHEGATGLRMRHGATIGLHTHEGVTGLHTHEGVTGPRMQREVATDPRMQREVATGPRMQREAAVMGPVRRFVETTAVGDHRFVETTDRTRPGRHVMATANVRTAAMVRRREAATGRPTPREAAVRGRLRLGRVALARAVRAGTTIRDRCGTRATRRAAAGRSRHGRVVVAHRIDQEAGRHSGQDRLGARVQAANAAVMAEGRALAAGRAVLVAGHQVVTVGPEATAMHDRRAVRRIVAEDQVVRRGDEADRAGRRATRRDGLVAGRDL